MSLGTRPGRHRKETLTLDYAFRHKAQNTSCKCRRLIRRHCRTEPDHAFTYYLHSHAGVSKLLCPLLTPSLCKCTVWSARMLYKSGQSQRIGYCERGYLYTPWGLLPLSWYLASRGQLRIPEAVNRVGSGLSCASARQGPRRLHKSGPIVNVVSLQ